jgi:uncharacterized RDD family membrane protein YckC
MLKILKGIGISVAVLLAIFWSVGDRVLFALIWMKTDWVGRSFDGYLIPAAALLFAPISGCIWTWMVGHSIPLNHPGAWRTWLIVFLVLEVGGAVLYFGYKIIEGLSGRPRTPRVQYAELERLHFAGFWIRLGALAIDHILYVPAHAIVYFVGMAAFGSSEALSFGLWEGLGAGIWYSLFVSKWGGTPGKLICGLRVCDEEGCKLSYSHALGRFLASGVSMALLGIGFVIGAWTPNKRALHDYLAKSYVFRKSKTREPAPQVMEKAEAAV